MIRRRSIPAGLLLVFLCLSCGPAVAGETPGETSPVAGGYRLYESTVASVNGEVLFHSDLLREECLLRCGAFPGEPPVEAGPEEVRERRIREMLILQEERKLGLARVDNAVLQETAASAAQRMRECERPCAASIGSGDLLDFVGRRLAIREFLRKRVVAFVEVGEEEVRREIERRVARGDLSRESVSEEAIRRELFAEKEERAVRNWYDRLASKAKIVRTPLETP
ncbi:MAG: hypothetical protein Kow00128_08350 [Deltaproteobacteria bacterium]